MPLVKPTEKENLNFIRIGGVASRARGAVFKSAGADPPLLKRSQWGGGLIEMTRHVLLFPYVR